MEDAGSVSTHDGSRVLRYNCQPETSRNQRNAQQSVGWERDLSESLAVFPLVDRVAQIGERDTHMPLTYRHGVWLALVMLAVASPAVAQTMPPDALVVKKAEYELYYMPQYREDGERAVLLLDQAVAVAKAKYGTTYRGTACKVHLYPLPNGVAM